MPFKPMKAERRPKSDKSHLEQVKDWLEENVEVYPEPKKITLSNFVVDWSDFSGEFDASFDSTALTSPLRLSLDQQSGKMKFSVPIFHSPLGAPASYGAISFIGKTESVIIKALQDTFPRLRPAGVNRETGIETPYNAFPKERLEKRVLDEVKAKVTKGFVINIKL